MKSGGTNEFMKFGTKVPLKLLGWTAIPYLLLLGFVIVMFSSQQINGAKNRQPN